MKISLPEVVSLFKEIQCQPEKLFEMIRMDVREKVGQYLSELMKLELIHFLGREPNERKEAIESFRVSVYLFNAKRSERDGQRWICGENT